MVWKKMYYLEKDKFNALNKMYENTKSTCDYFCKELKEKNERIRELENARGENERLKELCDKQKEVIDRQNRLLTEHDRYEKKKKESAPTGVPAIDAMTDRLLKLEAKIEAQENPYFF